MRSFRKAVDRIWLNKASLLGLGLCFYMSRRVSNNMKELEQNTQDKKLFDPLKAKAQIEVYKEIYNFGDEKDMNEEKKKDTALRILQSASENDIEMIRKYFEKNEETD